MPLPVIPAKAGIHNRAVRDGADPSADRDSYLCGNDGGRS